MLKIEIAIQFEAHRSMIQKPCYNRKNLNKQQQHIVCAFKSFFPGLFAPKTFRLLLLFFGSIKKNVDGKTFT